MSERERYIEHILELLRDAKARCNTVAAARRRIGPIATQAQSAAHLIAQAEREIAIVSML